MTINYMKLTAALPICGIFLVLFLMPLYVYGGSDNADNGDNPFDKMSDAEFNSIKDCSDYGYADGRNGPFDVSRNDECQELNDRLGIDLGEARNTYYDAFINGCTSVEGNTKEICEDATD